MRSKTGRGICWEQRTERGARPADHAPGDDQPDGADHEEQRDEVMQAAAVAVSPMYIPGRFADLPVPPWAGRRTPDAARIGVVAGVAVIAVVPGFDGRRAWT